MHPKQYQQPWRHHAATTRFLGVGEFTATATLDRLNAHMNQEVPATLKLYLDCKLISSGYASIVSVMTTETAQEASDLLGLFRWARSICFVSR